MYTNPPVNCHNGSTLPSKDGRILANRLLPSSPTNHRPTPLWSPTRLVHFFSSTSHSSFLSTARRHLFDPSPLPPSPPSISLSRTTATNQPIFTFHRVPVDRPGVDSSDLISVLYHPIPSINQHNHHGHFRLHVLRSPADSPACRLHLWLQAQAQA